MNVKLTEFIQRNRKRNAHLYSDLAIEGYDYVVCPVSNQRLSMIKDNYIIKILGMDPARYPAVQRVCHKRKENIKRGLKEIDAVTGLSKYEVGQIKARKSLKQVDSSGLTGYDRKGQRTRATHMSKIDQYGRNGYRRQADARLNTVLPNGLTIEQNAHIKQRQTLIQNKKTGSGGASKQSKRVLTPIIDFLNKHKIKYYFDKTEYGIKDIETGNYYFWDLVITDFNFAIEYQSSAWHASPFLSEDKWNSWAPPRGKRKKAKEVLQYDYDKARALYKNRGIVTYFVWQETEQKDVEDILCLLKTMIMKS